MVLRTLSLMLLVAFQLCDSAYAQQQILVIVPYGTEIHTGDTAVLLGRPLGVVAAGDCGPFSDNAIFNVVLAGSSGGGATAQTSLIVTEASEPVSAGARLTEFDPLGICTAADGHWYDRYRVTVESRDSGPAISTIEFIVAPESRVTGGNGSDIGVVLGRPLGTVEGPVGDCSGPGSLPIYNVVFTHRGAVRSTEVAAVIIVEEAEPMPPGTRLGEFVALGFCTSADGAAILAKYRATLLLPGAK